MASHPWAPETRNAMSADNSVAAGTMRVMSAWMGSFSSLGAFRCEGCTVMNISLAIWILPLFFAWRI